MYSLHGTDDAALHGKILIRWTQRSSCAICLYASQTYL